MMVTHRANKTLMSDAKGGSVSFVPGTYPENAIFEGNVTGTPQIQQIVRAFLKDQTLDKDVLDHLFSGCFVAVYIHHQGGTAVAIRAASTSSAPFSRANSSSSVAASPASCAASGKEKLTVAAIAATIGLRLGRNTLILRPSLTPVRDPCQPRTET